MNDAVEPTDGCLSVRRFTSEDSSIIVDWVRSDLELRWLAPSIDPPLTAAKILGWKKQNGEAYVAEDTSFGQPVAYGELNAMSGDPSHLWLGHCLVRPEVRGRCIGREFVRALLKEAFENRAASRVSLVVFPGNHSAIHCYLSSGFSLIGDEYHQFQHNRRERLLRLEANLPIRSAIGLNRFEREEAFSTQSA